VPIGVLLLLPDMSEVTISRPNHIQASGRGTNRADQGTGGRDRRPSVVRQITTVNVYPSDPSKVAEDVEQRDRQIAG